MAKTILIVDDDPNIIDTAQDILEDAGFVVHTAGTGAAALKVLQSGPADLAILDFNLPDAKGVELAAQAKKICPKIIILLMSGEANVDLGPTKAFIADVLTKPVNPAELIGRIRKILG